MKFIEMSVQKIFKSMIFCASFVALTCVPVILTSVAGSKAFAQSGKDELETFKKALGLFKVGKYEAAITAFEEIKNKKTDLQEYAIYYLAESRIKLNQWDNAEKDLNQILALSPNRKMTIEVSNLLGQVALEKQNFKRAALQFAKLEKITRNTDSYPEVIYNLARSENGLKNHSRTCNWLVKLYEKYPSFSKVSGGTADLAADDFAGKPSGCSVTTENFRVRVRYLLWAGLDQKAQNEINFMKAKLEKSEPFTAAKLQAQFYLQEGELSKGLQILTPFFESMKRNFDFLILYGSATARAGDVQQAVGAYYSAYKLSPKSKTGRQALYQSAFLSYQFQDYDGAGRRFQEFIKVYPTSGLKQDAKWHLAWLKYLKADYSGAYKSFAEMQQVKGKRHKSTKGSFDGRVSYWMAMSLFRQGKKETARNLMESLSKDPLLGYYAIAAQARLKKIESAIAIKSAQVRLPTQPLLISRFTAGEFLMSSNDDVYRGEEAESEEDVQLTQYSTDDEKVQNEEPEPPPETTSTEVALSETSDLTQTKTSPSGATAVVMGPVFMKRFERARDLMILEENEWARWDLFDIERKTSSRDYLRTLMSEYNTAGVFNRSSYIAQISFSGQRAAHGIDGVRYLWEFAYPRAYVESVGQYATKFVVPEELIWGIMRAESTYRKDAISPVGALGLMQVMPYTGHKVATLLGDKEFKVPMLLEPATAVKVGTRYLKRLMDRFENTIPLVAAGYNAGPHRVKNWLVSFGKLDTDEFIEHIPFLETRNYVKRVVSNAYIYSQLYGNKKDLFPYLSEQLPVKVNSEIAGKENWDDI